MKAKHNEIEIKKSVSAMLADIENIQGFITQEIIKNIQFNDGKIFEVGDEKFKQQIDSLLNADPNAEINKGKAVLSFKATEVGITKKLAALEDKGAEQEQINKVKNALKSARENLTKKLSTKEGLNEIISNRLASQLLLNSANFMIIDSNKNEQRFLLREEKQNIVNLLKDKITIPKVLMNSLLDPTKINDQDAIKKSFQKILIESFASEEKSASGNLSLIDMAKLNDKNNIKKFSELVDFDFKTREISMVSSESLKTYSELGNALVTNVRQTYKNGSIETIQNAFKEGGKIHLVINSLAEKEKKIVETQKTLNQMKVSSDNTSIKQELLNNSAKELEAIKSLQSKINQLSVSIGATTSNFSARKAINEFQYSIEQNKEVKQGFVGTLFSVVYNAFARKNSEQLEAANFTLDAINEKLVNENNRPNLLNDLSDIEKTKEFAYDPSLPNSLTNKPPVPKRKPEGPYDSSLPNSLTNKPPVPKGAPPPINLHKKDGVLDMNAGGFIYSPDVGNVNAFAEKTIADSKQQAKNLLNNKNEKEQLNILYSGVINGNISLIKDIIEYDTTGKVFTKDNCKKLYDAALEVQEKSSTPKKVIIAKGIKTLAKVAELDLGKNSRLER